MFEFFANAIWGVVIMAIVTAIVGTYIVTRRQIFIAGGITHACFGGLGLGYFLGISPEFMAALAAVGGALGVDRMSRSRVRRDSAIAVVWALGMALGVLFIFLTSGYVPELNSFLFGNVLTVSAADNVVFAIFGAMLIGFYLLFHKRIVAVSFDEDFARTRGLPVKFINIVMTVFTAVAIVLAVRMVGIMLLMSLVSLPQMTAELFSRRYFPLMLLSMGISLAGSLGGLALAWVISVPASAAIVLILAAIYIIAQVAYKMSIRCRKHVENV